MADPSKKCFRCGETKPLSAFYKRPGWCKPCHNAYARDWAKTHPEKAKESRTRSESRRRDKINATKRAWYEANPEWVAEYNMRRNAKLYDLPLDEYRRLIHETSCAICGSRRRLSIDHCHTSNALRGILCGKCNLGLGYFNDDPNLLAAAAEYLTQPRPAI